jgi:glycosyltransferase involved in cell wall biosynthesis
MADNNKPLVSIFCLAYNHEAFIEKAIESWLMQKTDFMFEAVIGEDNSTDRTREIVFDYAKKYPEIFRVITSESNVGMRENAMRTRMACTGKYIAFCEGDDYWIDPLKLQKQIDIMEAHPEYSLCFHDAITLWDDKSRPAHLFCPADLKEVTGTTDVINGWYIPTASMLMLNDCVSNLPDWFQNVYNGDWALQMILSTQGKFRYIDEPMSVYRKNQGGMSGDAYDRAEDIIDKKIELLRYFDAYSKKEYTEEIAEKIKCLEKEKKDYSLKKRNKMLYRIMNPGRTLKKFFR